MKEFLVPPLKVRRSRSRYEFPKEIILSSIHDADRLPLRQLKGDLADAGIEARLQFGAARADITLRRNRSITHAEGYHLRIEPKGIEIVASTSAGAYYGIQTLRDIVRLSGKKLPCCEIDDEPVFSRRAVYHDCSRGKVPKVQTVKALIEFLARWKVNELQLYIENPFPISGCRLKVKTFSM